MWLTAEQTNDVPKGVEGGVFRRVDASNAVLIYLAPSCQKQPLGYYYANSISWNVYEIVGEVAEGIFSCMLAPVDKRSSGEEGLLTGQIRFARQTIGRVQVLNRQRARPFLVLETVGGSHCWTARQTCGRDLALADRDSGEFLRAAGGQQSRRAGSAFSRSPSVLRRVATMIRTLPELQQKAELRVALLTSLAVMLSDIGGLERLDHSAAQRAADRPE